MKRLYFLHSIRELLALRLLGIAVMSFYILVNTGKAQTKSGIVSSMHGPSWNQEPNRPADALPPSISFTPLPDVCTAGARTLVATITDPDGVPTSGSGLPVLYYQETSGPWYTSTGVHLGGNNYQFSVGNTAIVGDIVYYYIVAQDNSSTPNVGSQPSAGAGGFTANPPAAATQPTTPNFYVIQNTLNTGTYLVGPGQVYVTITDAVNAYNNACLNGPVVFALTDITGYGPSETFPITIYNPAASAVNTLTIKPNTGVNTSITGNQSEALFKLFGADYITIDGSNNGTTSRNLTITNTGIDPFSSVIWVGSQSSSNGATNNTIRNCRLNGNSGITPGSITYAGIISCSGANIGFAAEAPNSNNTYRNNTFEKLSIGVHLLGALTNDQNTTIDRNSVGSTIATNHIGFRGIWANNQANLNIQANTVFNITSNVAASADTDPPSGIILNGTIATANVHANIVNTIRNTNVAGYQSYGITLQSSSTSSNTRIYNNMIYGITGNGDPAVPEHNGMGIALLSGGGYGIYFNAIHLIVNQSVPGVTAPIFIGSGMTNIAVVDIRNNIFSNRQTTGTRYCIYSMVPNTVFSQIDYNCYYTSQRIGFLTTNHNTLAAWQIASGNDVNSNAVNPIFISPSNLRLQLISPLNNLGTPISGISTDIDNVDVRDASTPDFGCDEIFPPACAGNLPGTASASRITLCFSGSVLLSSTGFSFGLGMSYQWEVSTDNITFVPLAGETNPTSGTPPPISATTYYRLRVACTFAGGTPSYSNVVTVTVQSPSVTGSTPGSRCGPGTVVLGATSSAGTSVQWYDVPTGGEPLATGNSYTTPSISANTTYYAEATYPGSNGAVGATNPVAQGGTISTQFTSWEVYFNVLQATTLLSIDVYPLAANETSTLTIHRSDNTVIAAIPYITTVSGGATAQTIPINVPLDPGLGYYLYTTNSDAGLPPSGISRNISGAVYPYTSSDIEITGNAFNNSFFMGYYRWRFSNACASVRTPVTASITSAADITVSASIDTLCIGSSTNLTVSSANTSFTYTWTPGGTTGSSITVSPTVNTKYIVNATDGSCTSKDSIIVNVISAPSDLANTPNSVFKCSTDAAELLTTSGGVYQAVVIDEKFNGGLGTGWTVTGTAIASKNWNNRPNNYSYSGNVFRSNDSSDFMLAISDGNGGNRSAILNAPVISTAGLTNASIYFWHHYSYFGLNAPDSIAVEASLNGSSYTTLRSWKSTRGARTNFRRDTVTITPAFLNQPVVYLRFRYQAYNNFWWAIDNVMVVGNDQQSDITWSPLAGLYTDAAATIPYSGGNAFSVYAKPIGTTSYVSKAAGLNGCEKTDTTVVNIRPPVTGIISGSTAVCPSGAATITVTLTGTAPWSITYTDGSTPVTVNGINTSPYTFVVNPLVTTTYTLTAASDAYCTATSGDLSGSAVVTVNPTLFSTWLGLSNDWQDPTNWCGGVPTNIKDVVIPGSLTNYPIISNNLPVARNLQIDAGGQILIAAAGTLSMTGDFVNNGTLQNDGTIILNGSTAQSFPGGTGGSITAFHNFEINKPAGAATLNRDLYLTGTFTPTSGNVILEDTLTIGSRASGTARIAAVGSGVTFTYSGAGKFTVERYIPTGVTHGKTWQLLAAATVGQTVNQSWQEGAAGPGINPKPGYGTTLTSNLPGALGLGFDFYTPQGGSSIKVYNSATNLYDGISSTNAWQVANQKGYMMFVRGDRSVNTSVQPAVPVTLRTTGKIYAPGADAPASLTVPVNKFESVGNPYASAIDFLNLRTLSTGLDAKYYVWDPLLPGSYGLGGFQTLSSVNGYIPVPGNTANYPAGIPYTRIQSGQAFFVFSTPGGTVNFAENIKSAGTQNVFRPGPEISRRQYLRTYLYTATGNLADGNVVAFDDQFSRRIDEDDALKPANVGENLGIRVGNAIVSVEARPTIQRQDTLFYDISNLRSNQVYQFRFRPERLYLDGLQAYWVDQYLRRTIPISLMDETDLDFQTTQDAASKAANRFYLLFDWKKPFVLTADAIRRDGTVWVQWKGEEDQDIAYYVVEKEMEAGRFAEVNRVSRQGKSGFSWTDKQAGDELLTYIVRGFNQNHEEKGKQRLVVQPETSAETWMAYPNPVQGQHFQIRLTKARGGSYKLRMLDASGKLVYQKICICPEGPSIQSISMPRKPASGTYQLEWTGPDGRISSQSLIIQ